MIFDRWGNRVYEVTSETGNFAWDGKNLQGKDCADGTYFYVITAKGKDEVEYEQKGNVSLYR
jgi:gliding motility-associated-like protein